MRSRSLVGRLATVLLCGVLAGLVLAAAVFPGNLLFGLAMKSASETWGGLPQELRTPTPAQRTVVYAADGRTPITSFYDVNRRDVPLAEIAPVMRQAVVAAEDRRFYSHGGVDLRGLARALVSNAREGTTQGASTLTMQYVRNVLKSDPERTAEERESATEVSVGRKLQEIRYAAALEQTLDKDEILARYLNIAYFGSGAYGIAAASERYFSVTPAELTLAQAALLAGLVQSPNEYSPIDGDQDAALVRRSYVLDSMVVTGAITAEQAEQARAEELTLDPTEQPNGCTALSGDHADWGFFCDYLRSWWLEQPAFGSTVAEREQALNRGGYTIVTSLDPAVQASALRQSLAVFDSDESRALPIAAVEPGTGRVLAMAVNRNYSLAANPDGQDNRPNTVNQLVAGGGAIDGYQAGSTFKLFTMLAALESGLPLDTEYYAPTRLVTRHPAENTTAVCGDRWCPSNADPASMNGYRTMWDGFGRSVNTYFVRLSEEVGPAKVVEMAERLGIRFRSDLDENLARTEAADWGAFTLGVSATTPLDLANAYATVAAEGTYCEPLPVLSIAGPDGAKLPAGDPSCRRVLDADVARAATDAARCPVGQDPAYGRCTGGTATTADRIVGGRPLAGKSGTSDQDATKSFVAYTPQVAVAGIAANPDDPTDRVGISAQSGVVAAVARVIDTATEGEPEVDFTPPSRRIALGDDGQAPPSSSRSGRDLDLDLDLDLPDWLDRLRTPR
ncbi:glycosyl transferase [Micromonospora echinospora]|nr:transglycosylase domain-containing protein [Micromonospora echinospora]OZV76808.1 glycosyl transferase [Micromonospora echinospora]